MDGHTQSMMAGAKASEGEEGGGGGFNFFKLFGDGVPGIFSYLPSEGLADAFKSLLAHGLLDNWMEWGNRKGILTKLLKLLGLDFKSLQKSFAALADRAGGGEHGGPVFHDVPHGPVSPTPVDHHPEVQMHVSSMRNSSHGLD